MVVIINEPGKKPKAVSDTEARAMGFDVPVEKVNLILDKLQAKELFTEAEAEGIKNA